MSGITAEVAIVGGGIQGCATAFFLAQQGVRAVILEKDYAGRHASGVNGGGVRTLGRHLAEVPLALASRRIWDELPALLGDDGGFLATGQLRIAETEAEAQGLRDRLAHLEAAGFRHEVLIGTNELRQLAPAVASHCLAALYVASDGHALPYRATTAFRRRAEQRGARMLEGTRVTAAERRGDAWRLALSDGGAIEAPVVVNCAGAWADAIGAMLGDALPIEPNGSMQMVTTRLPRFLDPVVGMAGRSMAIKQFPNGTVVIGGGRRSAVDRATNESSLDLRGLAKAMRDALDIFAPLRAARIARFWSGIEGFTPDRIPIIGPGTRPGVFHAAGFSAHGFQLGPIIGRIMAELVIEGRTGLPIAPFALDRFSRA